MCRALAACILLAAILMVSAGCSLASESQKVTREKLRMLYPTVSDYKDYKPSGEFSLDTALASCPVVAVATPISKAKRFSLTATQDFMSMELLVHEVMKGALPARTIMISVPVENSAFMEVLARGSLYVFCLSPGPAVENSWATHTDDVFYLSDDEEIIPLKDDEAHRKAEGMPLQSFREYVAQSAGISAGIRVRAVRVRAFCVR
jgi:hypothetical protein